MTTHTQENHYLEVTLGTTTAECQVFKVRFTPVGRDKGKAEYPACPPPAGGGEEVVLTKGALKEGSAAFELWHDTTPTGVTSILIEAQQSDATIDYVLVFRFDDATADYQWSGTATVQPIENTWDKTDDRSHRGPVQLTILTSEFGRPAAQPVP
jgi:hypothetical protein